MTAEPVLGVDACPGGWVGIRLDIPQPRGFFAPTLTGLVDLAGGVLSVIAIDIPIGLPDSGVRQADLLVRGALGPRRSSVFLTPVRAAVLAATYDEANTVNRRLTGLGVSRQSYGLRDRILEAEEFVARWAGSVIEVHPELCFAIMGGRPMPASKKTWSGAERRRELLRQNRIDLDTIGPEVGGAGVDDVLDAAAAAWTARRFADGEALARPEELEVFSDGIAGAIWA